MNGRLNWFKLLIFLIGFVYWTTAEAQVSSDAQRRYKAAVQLVQAGNYERAKADLNALVQRDGPLAPYASYYYAVAAFRQKNFNQARLMIKQLMSRYPDWRKMDDVNYLLAAVHMEMGQYEDALEAIQQIKSTSFRVDTDKMEQVFLSKIKELSRLKQINRQYPDDRNVGLALIDLIQRTATDKDDLELSDRLTNRFGVPGTITQPTSITPATTRPSTTNQPNRNARSKGYYNVAVMFPFRLDDFNADRHLRSNQYVYDLYNGMKMAKAKLQEEGITINLFAYDLDNDANKALELVNSPAFAQTDLIIGPLYIEPNRIASAYANQSNILLLNPIATSSELVADQPLSFLAQPSLAHQAQKAAEQARNITTLRRAAIYFGTSRKDSLLAAAYQSELKRQNYQIVDFRKLSGSTQAMADAMQFSGNTTSSRSVGTVTSGAPVTVGHVFFASTNDEDGAKLIEALSRRKVNAPLIATSSAFDFYANSSSTFTRRDLYLIYPDFIDTSRETVVDFQADYLSRRNTIPSVFASEGYDMMLFFGRQLAKNSTRNRSLMRSDSDDYLMSGFDYTQSNENQIVPIVKCEGSRFVKIN
ncbi:tetratricopeptide repeat protein [Spirosoma sp. SC4-14]|uniref:ABC transporter substrate-binding protein n=1 Tax=Spirosoma sp. SC4-14 TaxID=3128900 RepID=UPI0030CAB447